MVLLIACSLPFAILTTVGIVASLLFESLRFFAQIPVTVSCSGCSGARRWRCAPIRSARPAPSARSR